MAKASSSSSLLQFRVGEDWIAHLDSTIREMGATEGSASDVSDRSSFIRDSVGVEVAFWKRSPYVCPRARHFVFVTQLGEFWYHREEQLRLNNTIAKLPASLAMKMAKRRYFREKYSAEEVQRVWLLNNATLWRRSRLNDKPLASESDQDGIFEKFAILDCGLPAGSSVIRESCYGLDEYAQTMKMGESGKYQIQDPLEDYHDHAAIVVDIPTRDLELVVIVDRALFREEGVPEDDLDYTLHFELRNREEIPFASTHAFQHLLRERFLERIGSSYPPNQSRDANYDEAVEDVKSAFSRFKECANRVSQESDSTGRLKNMGPEPEKGKQRIADLKLPSDYLFYRLKWSWVHVGIHLSVKWVKPIRR